MITTFSTWGSAPLEPFPLLLALAETVMFLKLFLSTEAHPGVVESVGTPKWALLLKRPQK